MRVTTLIGIIPSIAAVTLQVAWTIVMAIDSKGLMKWFRVVRPSSLTFIRGVTLVCINYRSVHMPDDTWKIKQEDTRTRMVKSSFFRPFFPKLFLKLLHDGHHGYFTKLQSSWPKALFMSVHLIKQYFSEIFQEVFSRPSTLLWLFPKTTISKEAIKQSKIMFNWGSWFWIFLVTVYCGGTCIYVTWEPYTWPTYCKLTKVMEHHEEKIRENERENEQAYDFLLNSCYQWWLSVPTYSN